MSHNGQRVSQGQLEAGDVLTVKDQLVLLCVLRSPQFTQRHFQASQAGDFGQADGNGIVGESQAIWELREQLAFYAASEKHVLVLGESGSGKELAARAIHQMSRRAERALVSRNAATFPATLIDAELFGNAPNYPNAGMAARPGVIGEAHQSSLLLDELGELPRELQAHLLRVLDSGGEYQRLGDAQLRKSDLRLIAATNRDPTELRPDIVGRLTLQVHMPSLRDRREDIPLLLRYLLLKAAQSNTQLQQRFCVDTPHGLQARFDPDLIEVLVRYPYSYNIRELDALLWRVVAGSTGQYVALTPDLRITSVRSNTTDAPHPSSRLPEREVAPADIVDALNRSGHNVAAAARMLGLSSRYALYRLMRKHDIAVERVE
jgi:DNA-binding NtrC family response regulator